MPSSPRCGARQQGGEYPSQRPYVHSNWSSSRTLAEVNATSMKRLSKIETADDPADGAGDE
jgi:hypothetical protein